MRCPDPTLRIDLSRVRLNAERFLSVTRSGFAQKKVKAFFSAKSHSSLTVLDVLAGKGFGCEAIRSEEIKWARSLRMPLIVSGFIKTKPILYSALTLAEYIVVETDFELERLTDVASSIQATPVILLRVKAAPDSKLGCSREMINKIAYSKTELDIRGVHFHVGWNVKDEQAVFAALESMLEACQILQSAGRSVRILNFGGGFCEHSSDPDQLLFRVKAFSKIVDEAVEEVHFEPGRYIVGDAGCLTCTIEYVDENRHIIYLNSCAYGFRLSGATPRATLLTARNDDLSLPWTLYGFWPSENDQAKGIAIKGRPRPGDLLVLENMGAYTVGLENQFGLERPVEMNYV
jgi:diaminopimelate decarboxylase